VIQAPELMIDDVPQRSQETDIYAMGMVSTYSVPIPGLTTQADLQLLLDNARAY
jgi:hypothetical protein